MGCGASSFPDATAAPAALDSLPDTAKSELTKADAARFLGFDGAALERLLQPVDKAAPPHFGVDALLDSVASGAIAALKGSWVAELQARGGKLPRRQDLPPQAFWTAKELRKLVKALGPDYALLFVALSYRCMTKDHPDPHGFHLAIVARVARLYMHSDPDCSPLTAAFKAAGLVAPDFALFWDFASLFQHPRTPAEDKLFLPGLRASSTPYPVVSHFRESESTRARPRLSEARALLAVASTTKWRAAAIYAMRRVRQL